MGLLQYPSNASATLKKQVFTSSGTFVLPSTFSAARPLWAKVTAVGGGGGGGTGFSAGGGGAGAVIVKDLGITGNLPITIGAGGVSGAESSNGGRGGYTLVGNAPAKPTNRVRNPFMRGLYGQYDTTGWSTTTSGSINVARGDYGTSPHSQYYHQRHQTVSDSNNFQGVYKSSSGIMVWSSSGDAYYEWLSDFFDLEAAVLYYYGVYTRTSTTSNTVTVTLEWYDSSNNQLGTGSLATFNYGTTSDNKYSNSATSPANTVKGRLRIRMRCANTNEASQLFGCYVSSDVNYCPWEGQGNNVFWTGALWSSYLSVLNSDGLASGQTPILAGGGGGGMRATDEGIGGWAQYRMGYAGGHSGGMGTSWSTTSPSGFTFGGDGGGAGSAPRRDIFRANNATTPFTVSNGEGFQGYNTAGVWRTGSWRLPTASHYGRWSGNAGTSAMNITTLSSTEWGKWNIEGGRPHASGFGAGGPGCGYWESTQTEGNSRYGYSGSMSHFRELPFGNGGAAAQGMQNLNTSNFGYVDYFEYGDWPKNGDPGIVIIEWLES